MKWSVPANPSILSGFERLGGDIILLGGTFDPVHRGHIGIARTVIERVAADAAVFIPAKRNPLKSEGPEAPDSDRIEMLLLAVQVDPRFFVSDIELKKNEGPSYTVDTLRAIRKQIGGEQRLYFVCGADQLPSLHRWRDVGELFSLAHFIVVGRSGAGQDAIDEISSDIPDTIRDHLRTSFIAFSDPASATDIRAMIRKGEIAKARPYCDPKVIDYIEKNRLYRASGQ